MLAPSKLAAVLWDVDGTLVERLVSADAFVRQALLAVGVDPSQLHPESLDEAQSLFERLEPQWRTVQQEATGWRRVAAALLGRVARHSWQVAALGERLAAYYPAFAPWPGMRELLATLHRQGVRQAVLSNWPPSLRPFLAYHGLSHFFSVVVVSGEEGIAKPDARLFWRALNQLGVEPGQVLYIGNDLEADIRPAKALGLQVIHFDPRREWPHADARQVSELQRLLSERLGWAEGQAYRQPAGEA